MNGTAPIHDPAPEVDVLLPLKNADRYLEETLASLERQTDCVFRVLAWDNGSTDGTVELLERWIPDRLPGAIIADRPLALGACLASLVELAEAEFVARIDGDDVATPGRLAVQAAALRADLDLVAVCGFASMIDADGNEVGRYVCPTDDLSLKWMVLFTSPFMHPNMMLRRQAALDAGNYRDCMPVEDYDLWLRLAPLGRFRVLDVETLRYRVHDTSVSAARRRDWQRLVPPIQRLYWPRLLPGIDDRDMAMLSEASRFIHSEQPTGRPDVSPMQFTRVARAFAQAHGVSLRTLLASPGFRFTRRKLFRRGLVTRAWRLAWSALAVGVTPAAGRTQ